MLLAGVCFAVAARAQSADAMLDLLLRKGLITSQDAREVKELGSDEQGRMVGEFLLALDEADAYQW